MHDTSETLKNPPGDTASSLPLPPHAVCRFNDARCRSIPYIARDALLSGVLARYARRILATTIRGMLSQAMPILPFLARRADAEDIFYPIALISACLFLEPEGATGIAWNRCDNCISRRVDIYRSPAR
jgi:hypothetical protein